MSSSDQTPLTNDDDFSHHNKIRFNSEAQKYESIPLNLTIAKNCCDAIINEIGNELDPEKTEVLDFACGTGMCILGFIY